MLPAMPNVTCHHTATIPWLPANACPGTFGSLSHLRISTGFYAAIYINLRVNIHVNTMSQFFSQQSLACNPTPSQGHVKWKFPHAFNNIVLIPKNHPGNSTQFIFANQPQGNLFIYLMLFPELEPIRLPENDAQSARFFQCLRSKKREDFMGL